MEKKKLKSSPHELTKKDMLEFFKQKKESGAAIKALLETAKYLEGDDAVAGPTGEPVQGWKWLMNHTQNKKGKIVFLNPSESITVSEHFIKVDPASGEDMTAMNVMKAGIKNKILDAQFGTSTGKMPSSEPSLSQIPKSGSGPLKLSKLVFHHPKGSKKYLEDAFHDEMTHYPESPTDLELKMLGTSKSYEVGTKSGFELFKTMMKSGKSEPTLSETVEQLKDWQKSPAGQAMGHLYEAYPTKWVDADVVIEFFDKDKDEDEIRMTELCTKGNPQPSPVGLAVTGKGGPIWTHDEVDTFMNTATQTVEFKCKHCQRRWAVDKGEFTALITADRIKVLQSLWTEEWE